MTEYLRLKESNCKNCHKCIRYCPVKAISFGDNQANILEDECILCGQCLVNCPQQAKVVCDDVDKAQALLAGPDPVYVSLAPSFVAACEGAGLPGLRRALKALGFAEVEETAIGAALVKRQYERMIAEGGQRVIISSCCHSVNLAIQKYYPDALPYLAKVASPMLAHGADIKRRTEGAKVVFIGPCISKKAEADAYPGSVDCVLTFEEMLQWFEREGLSPDGREEEDEGKRSGLFPVAGGIIECMNIPEGSGYEYVVVDGMDNCIAALKDVGEGKLGRCFIEMSACAGSCIGGPVLGKHRKSPVGDRLRVTRRIGGGEFDVTPDGEALKKNIPFIGSRRAKPGGAAITDMLRKMGKFSQADELNCGTCGYDTCREKAEAILQGKAEISMCLPFLMEKAQSFSDAIIKNTPNGVIVLNHALEIQQLNASACRIMNVADERDVLGRPVVCILDPTPLYRVANEGQSVHEMRLWLAEYRKWVTLTAVPEKNSDLVICIIRDITGEELTRAEREELGRKAIAITDEVIAKQMRTVQEIASLLGETTAETKVALSNLKETLRHD